jgi:tetratricopeptide (TPR) repeat protein
LALAALWLLQSQGAASSRHAAAAASASLSGELEALARQADAAREAGRLDEAQRLYEQILAQRPRWAPGWGHLGTMAYDRDRFRECRDAFRRFVALDASSGPAWALAGLCEFKLEQYVAARRSLDQALGLGVPHATLLPVVLYHAALLRIRASEFEAAIPPLTELATARVETEELRAACGLVLLRRPQLPADVAAADRELVRRAGRAYCEYLARRSPEARAHYGELLAGYPEQEHLHYGYGLLLAQLADPAAADQFRREIELHPRHALAHLELSFELLRRGQAKAAIAPARAAVKLAPGLFATHLALGRALVDDGDLARGIVELETAARLAPGVRETRWALAGAYASAGRSLEAQRERDVVRKLDAVARERTPTTPPAAAAKP